MTSIKTNGEESLALLAVRRFGTLAALFDVAALNAVSIDSEPPLNGVLFFQEWEYDRAESLPNSRVPVVSNLVKPWEDQTAIDMAMQCSGTIENVFEFLEANGLGLTDELVLMRDYKKCVLLNAQVAAVFNNIRRPASGYTVVESQLPVRLEGIDYWGIEDDFVVS